MTDLTISEAKKILDSFSGTTTKQVQSEKERTQLQQALKLFSQEADCENLGICADDATQGFVALNYYLQALGYNVELNAADFPDAPEPIYIKFNTQKMSHYFDRYIGEYRGVLISCQSEDDRINGTYGHLPLNLFE
ncbi:DUF1824 family protein [Lusitaniella coriacea LEGE 07157]|uniref:DUF1824 family protein n=1 Tax=Lusitaniella coriacea LEGE 07157 TaxID=945747 RepID=A0A8J7ART6_9CYAN|nr:DUF1824 family protein [Lusitaniella coriacea]MBE9115016.1 DUF1824 family protein [Lusitaniella coriacea LEGE 07157]